MVLNYSTSSIGFRGDEGDIFRFDGISVYSAIVFSPLVEVGGSGAGLTHPQAIRTIAQKRKLSVEFPEPKFNGDLARGIGFRVKGEEVKKGDALVWRANAAMLNGRETLLKYDGLGKAVLMETPVSITDNNGNVTIEVEVLELAKSALCEKLRGVVKLTGDGGFNRNIQITYANSEVLVYDPVDDLRDESGKLVQCELVYGAEEAKTLNAAINMAGDAIYGNGKWENEEALIHFLQTSITQVDVYVVGVEQAIYDMLLAMHGGKAGFEFNDAKRRIVHRGAYAYVGHSTYVVEVPLTRTFCGKASFYFEAFQSLRVALPSVARQIMEVSGENFQTARRLVNFAGQSDREKFAWMDSNTAVIRKDGSVDIRVVTDGGYHFVSEIVLPGYIDNRVMNCLQDALEKLGLIGLAVTSTDGHSVQLDLRVFARFHGSASSQGYLHFTNVFGSLTVDEAGMKYSGWESNFNRGVKYLDATMVSMVTDGKSLMSSATRTAEVGITMRARASIFLAQDELVISPATAKYFKLVAGDMALVSRIPIPGCGVFSIVIDDTAADCVAYINPLSKHRIEEGDVDGDQMVMIILDKNGKLKLPFEKPSAETTYADTLAEVLAYKNAEGPFTPDAYQLCRPSAQGKVEKLPFAEFYELESMLEKFNIGNSGISIDRLGETKAHGVIPLYQGIVDNMSKMVSTNYFVFSALLMQSHVVMARLARKYKTSADLPALRKLMSSEDAAVLHEILMACEVASRIGYEGDALGGYKPASYKLYGRLFGIICPESKFDESCIAGDVIARDRESYEAADSVGKDNLFCSWWNDLHGDLEIPQAIVRRLHRGYCLVALYRAIEQGKAKFNPDDSDSLIAVLCGYARRSAKGVVRGNGGKKSIPAFYQLLWNYNSNSVITQAGELFKISEKGYSEFGVELLRTIRLYVLREGLVSSDDSFEDEYYE